MILFQFFIEFGHRAGGAHSTMFEVLAFAPIVFVLFVTCYLIIGNCVGFVESAHLYVRACRLLRIEPASSVALDFGLGLPADREVAAASSSSASMDNTVLLDIGPSSRQYSDESKRSSSSAPLLMMPALEFDFDLPGECGIATARQE